VEGRQDGRIHLPCQPDHISFGDTQGLQPARYLLGVSIQIGVAPTSLPVVYGEACGIQRERSG
jgi:hypothetical protein